MNLFNNLFNNQNFNVNNFVNAKTEESLIDVIKKDENLYELFSNNSYDKVEQNLNSVKQNYLRKEKLLDLERFFPALAYGTSMYVISSWFKESPSESFLENTLSAMGVFSIICYGALKIKEYVRSCKFDKRRDFLLDEIYDNLQIQNDAKPKESLQE
ncbi:MAG: hypothetical protein PHN56_03420 [Candidatus Nanoarchaeia archaeon]|nr:hypothetical protein [Candidatus Nanoarchaeia archaeon]